MNNEGETTNFCLEKQTCVQFTLYGQRFCKFKVDILNFTITVNVNDTHLTNGKTELD